MCDFKSVTGYHSKIEEKRRGREMSKGEGLVNLMDTRGASQKISSLIEKYFFNSEAF